MKQNQTKMWGEKINKTIEKKINKPHKKKKTNEINHMNTKNQTTKKKKKPQTKI